MKGLKKGRIVLFNRNKEECASIVTEHYPDDAVDLMVFPPGLPGEVQTRIPFGKRGEVSTWRWPPKE